MRWMLRKRRWTDDTSEDEPKQQQQHQASL